MGLVKSKSTVKRPLKSDYKKNINRAVGGDTLDNVPFVYALQINPGEFKLLSLPYTVPTGKKFMITYLALTSLKINNVAITIDGNTIMYGTTNDAPQSTSLTQPLEVSAGSVIAKTANTEAAVGGFELEY